MNCACGNKSEREGFCLLCIRSLQQGESVTPEKLGRLAKERGEEPGQTMAAIQRVAGGSR